MKNKKTKEIYYKKISDEIILESLYKHKEKKTGLLVYEKGKIREMEFYMYQGIKYMPIPPESHILKKKYVRLPEKSSSYRSQTDLLNQISEFIHKYADLNEQYEKIAAVYILFTWIYDHYAELPYFRVIGDYGSGKSRMLKLVLSGNSYGGWIKFCRFVSGY